MASRQGLPSNPRAGRATTSRTAQRLRPAQVIPDPEPDYSNFSRQPLRNQYENYDEGYDTASSYIPATRESSPQRRWKDNNARQYQTAQTTSGSSEGSAVWNKVIGVASNLTISVSKAWASNIPKFSGEDTPPGGESRLTRAMKAYHLEKATSPTDLPAWLFDEPDRRVRSAKTQEPSRVTNPTSPSSSEKPYNPRSLRDIYDSAASAQVTTSRTTNHDRAPSKATDRLKALRDAKKGARRNLSDDIGRSSIDEERPVFERDTRPSQDLNDQPIRTPPRQRIGLPSGPRRF